MATRGQRPKSSKKERERVLELAAEGTSQREIAKVVFGDARYRGRVERILAATASASNVSESPRYSGDEDAAAEEFRPESDLELFRVLVSRAERAMLESDHPPSLADIDRLLKIKRQIDTLESLEQMNAIARGEW